MIARFDLPRRFRTGAPSAIRREPVIEIVPVKPKQKSAKPNRERDQNKQQQRSPGSFPLLLAPGHGEWIFESVALAGKMTCTQARVEP